MIREIISRLYEINAIKFGEFKLKSGIISPIYIDLRVIVSYPDTLKMIADAMWEKIKDLNFDLICGVPYTALPIATVMSVEHSRPMVMRRKEVKDYGTKKAIEGTFSAGQTVLIVEDLITSGSSVFETIEPLRMEGLEVKDIVVLLDREQGGRKHIEQQGYNLRALFTISEMIEILKKNGKINSDKAGEIMEFIQANQV